MRFLFFLMDFSAFFSLIKNFSAFFLKYTINFYDEMRQIDVKKLFFEQKSDFLGHF